ncbi:MAG: hypothetical protein H6672_12825 [Anaerolineaceae bacterium]|nr:hypothetical protein [Anaerolineaceae bacterium]
MRFTTEEQAITYIFRSLRKLRGVDRGLDEHSRNTTPTRRLLLARDLFDEPREYAVVTGSKGKGSTTVITAKLLQHLGHRVGLMTSPHLVSWRERIRADGRMIPEPDFLRILSGLAPEIDLIEEGLTEQQYFSPQGIFLAIALQWFDEQAITAAVLEVGRGGRFDDIALAPNKLSLFTPIMLEHADYLGPTLERIAWHKAGIIKPYGYAYSVPQAPEVLDVLRTEAETQNTEFNWIAPTDLAEYIGPSENGIRLKLNRYGEVTLTLRGRYQAMNASLAVIAAGNMHGRLAGIPHGSPEYVARIRAGLADVTWPGRCQKLQENPIVYIDGAINAESAASFLESVKDDCSGAIVGIVAVPGDKDYTGVYAEMSKGCHSLILTETTRNPILHFPDATLAVSLANQYSPNVRHTPSLADALELAKQQAGTDGTILIAGTQSIVADAAALWGDQYEII